MSLPIFQVDAFTDTPFAGNPAGVCILDAMPEDRWLADVAAEMNLSETAFLLKQADGWRLRWFTPTVEVKLCGHATLASAHVLYEQGLLAVDKPVRFHTLSGLLTARRQGDWIEMDFPADRHEQKYPSPSPGTSPALTAIFSLLLSALGAEPVAISAVKGALGGAWLVELIDEAAVRGLKPNFDLLAKLPRGCVIVTARATTSGADFVSRFFAPGVGINEDPVTGSAHCSLGPYWAANLGKTELIGRQVSRRGGIVKVALAGERVKLSGQAVTVFQGKLSRAAAP